MSEEVNENKVDGKFDQVKGEAKKAYGKVTDDTGAKIKGEVDKAKGKAKEKLGDIQDTFKDEK